MTPELALLCPSPIEDILETSAGLRYGKVIARPFH
jgi:hypothetical protein